MHGLQMCVRKISGFVLLCALTRSSLLRSQIFYVYRPRPPAFRYVPIVRRFELGGGLFTGLSKETAALVAGKHHDAVGRVPVVATAGGNQETAGDPSEPRVQPGREPEGDSGAKHWSGTQRRGPWAVAQCRGGATKGEAEDAIEVASAKVEARARKGPGGTEASRHFSSAQIAALAAN